MMPSSRARGSRCWCRAGRRPRGRGTARPGRRAADARWLRRPHPVATRRRGARRPERGGGQSPAASLRSSPPRTGLDRGRRPPSRPAPQRRPSRRAAYAGGHLASLRDVDIVAALFVENLDFRQVAGGSTRIDITGAFFSEPVAEFPTHITPHLVVLVRAPADDSGMGTLEAVFTRDGEEVARNAQQFSVEPGKFGYRLVRPELEFPEPGTIEARCTITESGSSVVVPLTAIPAP